MTRSFLPGRLPALITLCGIAVASIVGNAPVDAAPIPAALSGHAGSVGSAALSVPTPPGGVNRIAGGDRYLTGVLVSQSQWADATNDPTGRAHAQAVVLARGDNYPDALAGVPLAAKAHGPLLLTRSTTLTPATADEIARVLGLGSGQPVYILGGANAVSPTVEQQLTSAGYQVTRYSGTDRYGTALDVALRGLGDPAHVVVATGDNFADALASGPFAAGPDAVAGGPAAIVLSAGNKLDPATATYLSGKFLTANGDCAAVTAVGGKAVTAVGTARPPATCSSSYSGADRYATAEALAQLFGPITATGLATGDTFADALTGGAAMAALAQPLLLTNPKVLGDNPRGFLVGAHGAGLASFEIFGGLKAVGQTVEDQLQDISIGGLGLPPAPPTNPGPVPGPGPGADLCGAPSNPYSLNYCGRGVTIVKAQVPLDVCTYFSCIGTDAAHSSFWAGVGFLTVCNDGDISLSGGRSGACSSHGGENHPVWKG